MDSDVLGNNRISGTATTSSIVSVSAPPDYAVRAGNPRRNRGFLTLPWTPCSYSLSLTTPLRPLILAQ